MPSESPPVVSLRQVSKKYRIYRRPSHKFLELFLGTKRRLHREFWALREIDLEVAAGTTLGIVGRNGSGKSTLLQLVAGIHRQTTGDLWVRGTVSALLELGSGFNPEFTGRENMLMAGAVMGSPSGRWRNARTTFWSSPGSANSWTSRSRSIPQECS